MTFNRYLYQENINCLVQVEQVNVEETDDRPLIMALHSLRFKFHRFFFSSESGAPLFFFFFFFVFFFFFFFLSPTWERIPSYSS